MMVALIIISFFLDGIFLSFVSMDTFLCPLFSLLSLVLVYPFLSSSKNWFLIICGILGFFYDVAYTNTLFLNVFLFVGIGLFITKIFDRFVINLLNTYLVGMGVILIYRIMYCFFFVVLGFSKWRFSILLKSIFSSILLNSVYLVAFYFIAKKMRKELRKNKYKLLKLEKLSK